MRPARFLLSLLVAAGVVGLRLAPRSAIGEADAKSVSVRLAKMARSAGIEIESADEALSVRTFHGRIEASVASKIEIAAYQGLLLTELGRYPPAFLRGTDLKRIVLCRGLSFGGQARFALPDFEHDTLYLRVDGPPGFLPGSAGRLDLYLRKVFHHELFHVIDWKDDGELYADDAWAGLNAPSFRYGPGGADMRDDPKASLITEAFPGFVNGYSTAGVEEDKAEIFAHLMANGPALVERARADRVVGRKIERMVGLLDTFSGATPDLLEGRIPLLTTALEFAEVTVQGRGPDLRSPEIDAARQVGLPILLYVGRRAWKRDGRMAAARARAAARVEASALSDERVAQAAAGWTRLHLDVSASGAADLARRLGVGSAPALLGWAVGAPRPVPFARGGSLLRGAVDVDALVRKLVAGARARD